MGSKFTRVKQALLDAVEYVGEEKAGEYLAAAQFHQRDCRRSRKFERALGRSLVGARVLYA
jgi:hypothetical protein